MSTFLFAVGGLMLAGGLVTVGLGMPASALDFGNTLIVAGTTAAVGGVVVIALAAVVARLQHLAEALNSLGPSSAARGEGPMSIAPERRSAPPQPFEPQPFEPRGPTPPPEFPMPQPSFAPSLPNPEEAGASSRRAEVPPIASKHAESDSAEPSSGPPPALAPIAEESGEARAKSPFDFMWPAAKRESETSERARPPAPEPPTAVPGFDAPREPEKPRSIAVLKSGVVDGMSYTLYVDGSIEAELPQGTLRFTNIQELRAHLEKNG